MYTEAEKCPMTMSWLPGEYSVDESEMKGCTDKHVSFFASLVLALMWPSLIGISSIVAQ
jgi:hypothetical protein